MSTAEIITLNHESNLMSNVKKGHIVLHRSINNSEWSDDAVMFSLWAKLLCMASYKDRLHSFDGKSWHLKTGQLVTTYAILGRMVKINNQPCDKEMIRRIVRFFKSRDMLSTEKSGNSVIVTIKNYTQYQSDFFAAPKAAPETAQEIAQNNTLLNNTLNNNKTHMSSGYDENAPKIKKTKPDYQAVLEAYQEVVLDGLPIPDKINQKRKALIDKLFKEIKNPSVETVKKYFIGLMDQVKDKPFYFGGPNHDGWKLNFDYVLRVDILTKTREGAL